MNVGTIEGLLRLRDDFSTKLQVAANNTAAFGKKLQEAGENAERVGMKLSIALTAPLAALGTAAFKMSTAVEGSLTKLETLVGVSRDQVKAWKGDFEALAVETGKSTKELADGMFFITSAGLRGANALKALKASAQGAALGLGDTATIADAATSAMNSYGEANMEAARAVNIIALAVRAGKTEASALAPVLGRLLPTAAAMKIRFEDVAGVLAAMSRKGLDAAFAATSVQAIMSTLLKPTKQAKEVLDQVHLSFHQLREMVAKPGGLIEALRLLHDATQDLDEEALAAVIPNVRAFRGVMTVLAGDASKVDDVMRDVASGTDILSSGMKRVSEDVGFKFRQQLVALEIEFEKLGDALAPAFQKMTEAMKGGIEKFGAVVQAFEHLPSATRTVIAEVGLVAAAFGPLLFITGQLLKAWGTLLTQAPMVAAALTAVGRTLFGIPGLVALIGSALASWGIDKWASASEEEMAKLAKTSAAAAAAVIEAQNALKSKVVTPEILKGLEDADAALIKIETSMRQQGATDEEFADIDRQIQMVEKLMKALAKVKSEVATAPAGDTNKPTPFKLTDDMKAATKDLKDQLEEMRISAMGPLEKLAGEFRKNWRLINESFQEAGGANNAEAVKVAAAALLELSKAYDLAVIKTKQELFGGRGKGGAGGLTAISMTIQEIIDKVNAIDLKKFDAIVGAGGPSAAAAAYERMKIEVTQATQKLGEGKELQEAILESALKYKAVLDGIANESQSKINEMWDQWMQAAQVIVGAIGNINSEAGKWLSTMMGIAAQWHQITIAKKAYAAAQLRGDQAGMDSANSAKTAASVNLWVAAFQAIYGITKKWLADVKKKQFGGEAGVAFTDRGFTGGYGLGSANRGASSQIEGAIKDLLKSLEAASGVFVTGMQQISIKIRNDGKHFIAMVGNEIVGYFSSAAEAVAHAAQVAFSKAEISGTLSRAMKEMLKDFFAQTAEDLTEAMSYIKRIEDEASGLDDFDRGLSTLAIRIKEVMNSLREFMVSGAESIRLSGAWGLQQAREMWNSISGHQMSQKELREQAVQRAQMLVLQLKLWKVELKGRLDYLMGLAKVHRVGFGGGGGGGTGGGGGLFGTMLKAQASVMQAEIQIQSSFIKARSQAVEAQANIYQEEIDIINQIIAGIDKLISEIDFDKIHIGGGGFKGAVGQFAGAVKQLKEDWKNIAEDFRKTILDSRINGGTTSLAPRNALGEAFKQFTENLNAAKGGNVAAFGRARDLFTQLEEMAKTYSGGGTGLGFLGLGDTFGEFVKHLEALATAVVNGPVPSKLREGNVVFDERLHKVAVESLKLAERHQAIDQKQGVQALKLDETAVGVQSLMLKELKSIASQTSFRKAG